MTGIIEVDGKEAESVRLIFELVDLRLENRRLRAKLTAIKPAWSDAPEWATTWYIECGWAGGKHPNEEPYYMSTERRPEES